jgi:hypothetical protein
MQRERSFEEDQASGFSNCIGDRDQSEGHQPPVLCGEANVGVGRARRASSVHSNIANDIAVAWVINAPMPATTGTLFHMLAWLVR